MQGYGKVKIPCIIERGGFGNERTYRVRLVSSEEHIGIAPWIYCLDKQGQPIENEPAVDQQISGFIVGRLIRNGGKDAKIVFPDGAVCLIEASAVETVREETARVPVQP